MGHHLFTEGYGVLAIKDGSLELMRHFLIEGAKDAGLADVREAVQLWKWQGPGVWTNIETSLLARHPAVFESAIRAVRAHGQQVEIEYLRSLVPNVEIQWQYPQAVDAIVRDLNGLRAYVVAGA